MKRRAGVLRKYSVPYLFVLPCAAVLFVMMYNPVVRTFIYSFSKVELPSFRTTWVGTENIRRVFSLPAVPQVLWNTLVWVLGTIVSRFLLGFWAALSLNTDVKGRLLLRTLALLPWTVPSIVAANTWRWMLQADIGLVNGFLKKWGLDALALNWLGSPQTALGSVLTAYTWAGYPFVMIMLLAGMQGIPEDLYDAGKIDGASSAQAVLPHHAAEPQERDRDPRAPRDHQRLQLLRPAVRDDSRRARRRLGDPGAVHLQARVHQLRLCRGFGGQHGADRRGDRLLSPLRAGLGAAEAGMKRSTSRTAAHTVAYASAMLICLFSLIPILWGVSTSLKTDRDVYTMPPAWIPKPVTLANYMSVLTNSAMLGYFRNTAIIAFGATAISLVIGVLAAYGFSRYKFPGAGVLLGSILFTRVLPRVTLIVPFYVTLRSLKLLNTHQGLILIYLMVVMPISVWLLKGFFDNVPREIEEAATVDGCGPLGLLVRIILPISTPAIMAVGMYSFILAWNEFLFALLVSTDKTTRTISVGLAFYIDEAGIHWGPLMAASILMSIPAITIFTLSQKLLVKGLSEGSVKG